MESKSKRIKLYVDCTSSTKEEWVEYDSDKVSVPASNLSVPSTPYSEYDNWPGHFYDNCKKGSSSPDSLHIPVMVPPSFTSKTNFRDLCLDSTYGSDFPAESKLPPVTQASETTSDLALKKEKVHGCFYCCNECCKICWDNCCNVFCSTIGLACSAL